jgi:hypothetical protein
MLRAAMKKTLWDDEARASLLRRLDALTPQTAAKWGRMNAGEMLAHVVHGMRLGLGELEAKPRRSPFRRWPLKYLFIYWIPFPKGAPAPREIVTRGTPADWDANLVALRGSIAEIASRDRNGSWPAHPVFGALSGNAWGALGWRHLDHHLRQFGV